MGLQFRLHNLEAFRTTPSDLRDSHESEVLQQLQRAALLRAIYSPNQLRERMIDFWTNHFNIYARKGMGVYLQPVDHLKVVRENALGKFPEMLKASAKSPAMLAYLDNQVNEAGHPIRLLLATDVAAEGLNLQMSCRYVVHYEVPWNPMRLEQRNGRVDRPRIVATRLSASSGPSRIACCAVGGKNPPLPSGIAAQSPQAQIPG